MKAWALWTLCAVLLLTACGGGEEKVAETPIPQLNRATIDAVEVADSIKVGDKFEDTLGDPPLEHIQLIVENEDHAMFQLSRVSETGGLKIQIRDEADTILLDQQIEADSYILSDSFILAAGTYDVIIEGQKPEIAYILSPISLSTSTPTPTVTATPTITPTATATLSLTPSSTPTSDIPTATATPSPVPSGSQLEINQTISSEISQAGETDRYTLLANAGDDLALIVNPDPDAPQVFDPYIELQAPDGEIIAQNDNWQETISDAYIRAEFEVTGVYTVYVRAGNSQDIGRYLLSVSSGFTLRDVERGNAAENEPIKEKLATYGAREVWTIELTEGDIITVDVRAFQPDQLNVMAELVAPNDEYWFDDDSGEGTDALLEGIVAPVSGTYTIHIAARNNAYVGDYQLFWQHETPEPTISVPTASAPSDTIEGTVGAGEVFTFSLEIEAGQNANIVVIGLEDFDPVLRIIDPADNILIEVDDSEGAQNPRARFDASLGGLYRLEIQGFEGSGGSFTLSYIIQ